MHSSKTSREIKTMKKTNKKGFTLAELLVVVAIIAVLVAIAIPIFTSQLEKSREATDLANIRSAYAEATTKAIEGDDSGAKDDNGNIVYTATTPDAVSTGAFNKTDASIDWATLPTSVTTGKPFTVTITVDANGGSTATITQK